MTRAQLGMRPLPNPFYLVPSQAMSAAGSAAHPPGAAGASSWGVLVGISSPDYSEIKTKHTPIGVYSATGGARGWGARVGAGLL